MVPAVTQVIKANDDLTPEHHQFFLYQMLRGLKYIHTGAMPVHKAQSILASCVTWPQVVAEESTRVP